MTASVANHEQFTLHVSVAVRWWLYHLPWSAEADRFLFRGLAGKRLRVVAVDGMELQVLSAIVDDLGAYLDEGMARQMGTDVPTLFNDLGQAGILRSVSARSLARAAMVNASRHRLSFSDSLTVTLAAINGTPLLVADYALYEALKPIAAAEPAFRVAWLPDHVGS